MATRKTGRGIKAIIITLLLVLSATSGVAYGLFSNSIAINIMRSGDPEKTPANLWLAAEVDYLHSAPIAGAFLVVISLLICSLFIIINSNINNHQNQKLLALIAKLIKDNTDG